MATGGNDATQQYVRISDINEEPLQMYMPIRGYEQMPIVSLEEAVEPLVSILPEIQDYVYCAKQRCKFVPADGLTRDESASIILYSMEWEPHEECLYFALNSTLRTEDRQKIKPWFRYLKLILTGLARIPPKRDFVYRGVKMDLSEQYPPGKTFVWWGFSSCTSNIGVLESEQFLGTKGKRTMFSINCESGVDISRHSYYQSEKEILLLAARQFVVKACLKPAPDLHMIQLQEIESPITLLKPMIVNLHTTKPLSEAKSDPPVVVENDIQIKQTADLSEIHSSTNEKLPNVNPDENIKLITNEIICILELEDNEKRDEIMNDLLKNGRQSLNKYEEYLIEDIYTAATNGNDNKLMMHLRSYFEQQWKIQYNYSNKWFVQFLNEYKSNENQDVYNQVLTRTAEYGNKFMKNCPILSITLQLLFEGIDDQCLEETNIFNELWLTITTDGLISINKYSDYIIEDVMNEQIDKKKSTLFQALREYYRQELFPLLQQSNIADKQNLYDLALDNVAEFGWSIGLETVKKKIIPKNYKVLLEKLDSFLQQQQQQNLTTHIKDNVELTETTTQSIDILPKQDPEIKNKSEITTLTYQSKPENIENTVSYTSGHSTTKVPDDEDSSFSHKPLIQQVTTPTIPWVKKHASIANDDSDEEIISTDKKLTNVKKETQKYVASSNSDDGHHLFNASTSKFKTSGTNIFTESDEDKLFSSILLEEKASSSVVSPSLSSASTNKTSTNDDSLEIQKPVEATSQSMKTLFIPVEKKYSDSNEELLSSKIESNKATLEKESVFYKKKIENNLQCSVPAQVSHGVQASVIKESQQTEQTATGPIANTLKKNASSVDTASKISPGLFGKIGSWFRATTTENEGFARYGAYKKLSCRGRHCAKCGKCRDWYYTGDNSSWQWIRNVRNWKKEDWNTWSNEGVYERFKQRDGVTCRHHYFYHLAVLAEGGDDIRLACLCEDNTQNAF